MSIAMSAVAERMSLATSWACWPVRRMEPGKPAAGSSLTSPVALIEPPFGVVPAKMIDPNRAPVRDECPGHSGKLESRLIVAEFAAAQANRSLRLRLCNRPAQLKRDRERTRGVTAGHGKHGIGEAGVESAVDLHVERPVGREGSGAGDAHGVASPGIDCRRQATFGLPRAGRSPRRQARASPHCAFAARSRAADARAIRRSDCLAFPRSSPRRRRRRIGRGQARTNRAPPAARSLHSP